VKQNKATVFSEILFKTNLECSYVTKIIYSILWHTSDPVVNMAFISPFFKGTWQYL